MSYELGPAYSEDISANAPAIWEATVEEIDLYRRQMSAYNLSETEVMSLLLDGVVAQGVPRAFANDLVAGADLEQLYRI
jgi:hypothetical protein